MPVRLFALLLLPALLLPAAKKPVFATAHGENEDLAITVTLHIDPEDIQQVVGNDLGGHYFVAEVKVEPKYGKDILIDRDDFVLRTDKDGEKATPYSASQIAGSGGLVIQETARTQGIASPGWTDTTVPVVQKANAGGDSALKKLLDGKILPEGKTSKPVSGMLYFPMEKQKMKDLELQYGGRENRISLRFKP
ncbi:MAG TPA: hypothetical protein VMA31_07485 [Bryobacteraceae bacterium]|jgi:hypothetical protein|nr:hypothetical protein [Bryobacteraceae bacterium]